MCDPPRHLALTWEALGQLSWVDVTLDGGTRLTFEHVLSQDPKWDEFGPGAVGVGWDLILFGLGKHVRSSTLDPREAITWLVFDEGPLVSLARLRKMFPSRCAF
ncbi:MAG: hypothetical protein ABJF01_18995 [bacterium]